jgi:cytochrome c biogenesis protein CcmG, thiol:disulfide interchange protein DsbE
MTTTEAGQSANHESANDRAGSPTSTPSAPPARRSRVVLWASLVAAIVVAALFAVIVSARPSSEVQGKSPLLGRPAPAVSGPGLGGGHFALSQFKSKWVLVNFMATWCDPCQKEMPQLLDFARQHAGGPGGAVVFTIAYDPTNVAQLRKYLAEKGASWPAINDPSASVAYGVQELPSSFLVAPGGTVVVYIEGEVRASDLGSWMRQATARGLAA